MLYSLYNPVPWQVSNAQNGRQSLYTALCVFCLILLYFFREKYSSWYCLVENISHKVSNYEQKIITTPPNTHIHQKRSYYPGKIILGSVLFPPFCAPKYKQVNTDVYIFNSGAHSYYIHFYSFALWIIASKAFLQLKKKLLKIIKLECLYTMIQSSYLVSGLVRLQSSYHFM